MHVVWSLQYVCKGTHEPIEEEMKDESLHELHFFVLCDLVVDYGNGVHVKQWCHDPRLAAVAVRINMLSEQW